MAFKWPTEAKASSTYPEKNPNRRKNGKKEQKGEPKTPGVRNKGRETWGILVTGTPKIGRMILKKRGSKKPSCGSPYCTHGMKNQNPGEKKSPFPGEESRSGGTRANKTSPPVTEKTCPGRVAESGPQPLGGEGSIETERSGPAASHREGWGEGRRNEKLQSPEVRKSLRLKSWQPAWQWPNDGEGRPKKHKKGGRGSSPERKGDKRKKN